MNTPHTIATEHLTDSTEDKRNVHPLQYAELNLGATTLMYDAPKSPADYTGFRVVTRIYDHESNSVEPLYEHREEIDAETADDILDANRGWDYAE